MTEPESKNGKEKKRRKKRKHQHRPGQGRTLCNGKPEEEAVPGRRDTGVVVEGIHFFSECFVPILGSPAECRVRPRPASSAFRPNGHPCNWSCRRCCSLLNPCVFSFPPEALLVLAAGCWLLAAAWLLGCLAASSGPAGPAGPGNLRGFHPSTEFMQAHQCSMGKRGTHAGVPIEI